MTQSQGLDWYAISKLNNNYFDLQIFSDIVSKAQPAQDIDRVTQHYRKKLLILFQTASQMIKEKTPEVSITNSQLQIQRTIVSDNLHMVEGEVQESFKEITNKKFMLAEKKRLLQKLKQKLRKKGKTMTQKVYCCALCNRQDFDSAEHFKVHMEKQHNDILLNRSQNISQVSQLKDLLMTMKDKQIQMMSMFLKANKEMQTDRLERQFDSQYKKYMHISGAKTEESKDEGETVELKGQSQFLFFQKSDQFRRQMERDEEFRRKISLERTQRETVLKPEKYQPNNYYNVFGNISQNTSEHFQVESPNKRIKSQQKQTKNYGYYDPSALLSKYMPQPNISSDSRYTMLDNTPRPYVEGKGVEKQSIYIAPSISDRLKQQNDEKKGKPIETIYSTKRKFYEQKGYVFNSGPLVDDQGEGSDYQDYFGEGRPLDSSIQDEQIRANKIITNNSSYQLSKDSLFLSKLLSPKAASLTSNSLLQKSIKEKSSDIIVDLSDSFSKKDFQLSKDDSAINLSDLKLSKLEKKKEEERIQRMRGTQEKKPASMQESANSKWVKSQSNKVFDHPERKMEQTKVDILKQFEKPKMTPFVEQNFQFNTSTSKSTLSMFIKTNDRTNVLGVDHSHRVGSENSIGILNDFLREEFKEKSDGRPPKSRKQIDKYNAK